VQFEKIQRRHIYEDIVHYIEEMMLQQRLVPGDRLPPERELASKLGVSRSALRQALAVLRAKGLIEVRVGDGTYATGNVENLIVSPLADVLKQHRSEVVDPIEVRKLIEPQLAKLAAERACLEDVAELERLVQVQRIELQTGGVFSPEHDRAFHRYIATSTGNPILVTMVDLTFAVLEDTRKITLSTPQGATQSLQGHTKILAAIQARNPDKAYDAMNEHLEDLSSLILSSTSQENS
jgi:GntR family transcriptional regulator, transcriptional repressor for pyruvate dehydrogenase complex